MEEHDDGTITWRYEDEGTGGILYAGDYVRQDIEAGGITVQFYYGRKHQAIMEKANAAEAVRKVVDYCTEHYGPLSFGAGGSLKLIQSRTAGGGYATDGASLLDEADFTAANLSDPDKGGAVGEVFIHELVHQWWGLANMFDGADAESPWSAEGLTVYTTYRIVKELYGEDYAREHYTDQWQREAEDYYLNYYVRSPEYLQELPQSKQLEISNSLSRVRQYCEMPLKILKAETLVGGEEAMDQILKGLFNRELDWSYPYLTYQEFLDACNLTEEELNLGVKYFIMNVNDCCGINFSSVFCWSCCFSAGRCWTGSPSWGYPTRPPSPPGVSGITLAGCCPCSGSAPCFSLPFLSPPKPGEYLCSPTRRLCRPAGTSSSGAALP